jgi:hypothetical protein
VINGDVAAELEDLKTQEGDADILLAAGPQTLGPVISTPGLVDEIRASRPPVFTDVRPVGCSGQTVHRRPGHHSRVAVTVAVKTSALSARLRDIPARSTTR